MTIRPASADDFTTIQALNHLLFLYEQQYTDTYNENWMYEDAGIDYFVRRLVNKDDRSILLVAEEKDEIVSYIAGYVGEYSYRSMKLLAEIENMFVLEVYRNQGIGTTLVEEFTKKATQIGAASIKVGAYTANQKGISFYKKHGFVDHETVLEKQI